MDKALESAMDSLSFALLNGCAAPPTNELNTIRAHIDALTTRCEKAEADARRLDWFDARSFCAYRSRDPGNGKLSGHVVVVDEDAPGTRRGRIGDTIRQAIDAAIAATHDGQGVGS